MKTDSTKRSRKSDRLPECEFLSPREDLGPARDRLETDMRFDFPPRPHHHHLLKQTHLSQIMAAMKTKV